MASGPLVGGGGGGDGSREKQRWSENKVYTRKAHHKKGSKLAPNPQPPPPQPSASSHQTPVTITDDVHSSPQHPPPSPDPSQHPPPPVPPSGPDSAAVCEDDASSLNHCPAPDSLGHSKSHHAAVNGQCHTVTINLASCSHEELLELRRRLTSELEQVRVLLKRLEAHEQLDSSPPAAAPTSGYTLSQLSGNNVTTPAPPKRVPLSTVAASTAPARHRQISLSMPDGISESMEKEKRTPKANQYYNSDFVLGKEKFLQPDSHRKSKANGGKKQEPAIHVVDKKLYGPAIKSCGALLSKLMKHKFGWVFNTPVDVKGLGLHDYFSIIKHPMDLGTVKSRLSKNWYNTPEEFAEDVRLTFRNAMTYNPKGQDVHLMAEQLSQMFEECWPTIEAEYAHLLYQPPPKKPQPVDMRRTLERSDSTAHPLAVDSKPKPVMHAPHTGRPPALKKPKAKDPHKRDMTFEEKQKLSNNLQNLPPEKLDNIVQIIKKRNSSLSQHEDEIEVDIESVDAETLWELDRFVTNYKKSLSKNKRKAELAMLARAQTVKNIQERVPNNGVMELPKENRTVAEEKNAASSMSVGGEHNEDNASGSSSSCSSSSDSGSSSSDSDSESSSGYGSDTRHSPRT